MRHDQPQVRTELGRAGECLRSLSQADHASLGNRRVERRPRRDVAGDPAPRVVAQQVMRRSAIGGRERQPVVDAPDQLVLPAAGVDIGEASEIEVDRLARRRIERAANGPVGQDPQPQQQPDRQADREEHET